MTRRVLIEGYTPEELLNLTLEQMQTWVFTNSPLVFRIGSAEILGKFALRGQTLVVELAHIEGGGEEVLPTLWMLTQKFARSQNLENVEWIIHALNCAKPNPKLRPFLEKRGFEVQNMPGKGEAYFLSHKIEDATS